ncbi:MAG TPA: tetratricopeptide repeat protein [Candidatus Binataceae bacterium]|nr:tetratricopeptide repeat protein [Candidatus Binataceae bacterium]
MRYLSEIKRLAPWHKLRLSIALLAIAAIAGCNHKSADSYIQEGDQARQNAQLAQAEVDYLAAIKAAPDNASAHLALGNLYASEKKFDAARVEFGKALEIAPKDASAHAAIGGAYSDEGQAEAAENQYRAAVAIEPANAAYRLALGNVLMKGQKPGAAESELRTAIGLEPKNAQAHLGLANLLSGETNRQEEAQAEFAEVKAIDASLLPGATAIASPAPTGGATMPPAAGAPHKLREIEKRFKLTHDSPLYQSPASDSPVVGQVHRGKFVHITGIAGDWFRVQLKTGVVGFIPVSAAE